MFSNQIGIRDVFSTKTLGIIALVSTLSLCLLLFINAKLAGNHVVRTTKVAITKCGKTSGGRFGGSVPYVLIEMGKPNKSLYLSSSYSLSVVETKRFVVLSLKKGFFGWEVITTIELE